MGIRHGSDEILSGKLKLGAGDISKVYLGDNWIWPSVPTIFDPTANNGATFFSPDGAGGVKTFNANFGVAAPGRIIVACISIHDGDPPTLNNSVTIGGISAPYLTGRLTNQRVATGIFAAVVPTGTSGIVQWSSSSGARGPDGYAIDVFIIHDATLTGVQTQQNDSTVFTYNTPANHAVIFMSASWIAGFSSYWTNGPLLAPYRQPQGVHRCASYAVGDVISSTVTWGGGGQDYSNMAVAFPRG
jgi:hypothetical protein